MQSWTEGGVGGGLTCRLEVGRIHGLWVGVAGGVGHGRGPGLGHGPEFGVEHGFELRVGVGATDSRYRQDMSYPCILLLE